MLEEAQCGLSPQNGMTFADAGDGMFRWLERIDMLWSGVAVCVAEPGGNESSAGLASSARIILRDCSQEGTIVTGR